MKKCFVIAAFFLFVLMESLVGAEPFQDCPEYVRYGAPSEKGDLLCRKGFALAHNPARKTPDWVAEHLTVEKVNSHKADRDDFTFKSDPDLAAGKRAETSDYSQKPYDQGHMAPAADMTWNEQAMLESHYLSNVAPQVGIGMNRHIWADVELLGRQWTLNRGELYIFTGPIYENTKKIIGKNKVAVPTHFYKVFFDPGEMEAIAFIMPNKTLKRSDILKYLVNVDQVEEETGLNFFSSLSTERQKKMESGKANRLWQVCHPELKIPKYLEALLCPAD